MSDSNLTARRRFLRGTAAFAAAAVASPFLNVRGAYAAWPMDRPVRIVVANTPGGPSDLTARLIAPALQEMLGGSFIIENRPGGGGVIGMKSVINSDPDGYTLHLSTSIWAITPSLYQPSPYDPYKDLVPVAEIASSPSVFVSPSGLGAQSMGDIIALARKDQDKFNIGTPTLGSTLHLGAELLKFREKLEKVAVVIYPGGGQAVQAVLSNTVQICSSSLAPAHAHIQSGALKGLAILGAERWHDLPDVPTAEEAGLKDFNFETYTALMAPAKTPPDVVAAIEKAVLAALAKPDMREKIKKAGFLVQAKTAEQHKARIAKEVPMFHDIIKNANIKVN